jgi:hypothetical protein
MITEQDVAFYNDHGYLVVQDVLSRGEVEEFRRVTDEFVEKARAVDAHDDIYGLANDDEIKVARPRIGKRRLNPWNAAHWPDAGVKAEFEAQVELWSDFRPVGITDLRIAHGAKQDGVGRPRRSHHVRRERGTDVAIDVGSGILVIEGDRRGGAAPAGGLDDVETRRHDLMADAISRQHENTHFVRQAHCRTSKSVAGARAAAEASGETSACQ